MLEIQTMEYMDPVVPRGPGRASHKTWKLRLVLKDALELMKKEGARAFSEVRTACTENDMLVLRGMTF